MFHRAAIALLVLAWLAQPAAAATSGEGERLLGPDGVPLFVTGINYEGPADRAWQMWEPDKFDAGAIDADLGRAASAGISAVRIFIQGPLAAELGSGKWDKLDQVVTLAERHGLQLVVSLHDYGERDLSKVAATAGEIAQRYRARPGILALDLKNEPRFGDLALTRYASPPPLQSRSLIDAYGERLKINELPSFRASDEGQKTIPSYLSDPEAWVYVNNLRLYREMLADASNFVRDHNFAATTLDYLDDAAGKKWAALITALNSTLEAWLAPQVQAVRRGDPGRLLTVDHVDVVLARLPANNTLDFMSLHRYPSANGASIRSNLGLLRVLSAAHPRQPYVLAEFGYATNAIEPERASVMETAIMLGLLAQHAAGGSKWMLNDMPDGYNMRERTLGAFRLDGSPKPGVAAMAVLQSYLKQTGSPPGDLRIEDDPEVGARYVYRSSDALMIGGKKVEAGVASMSAERPSQVLLSWSEPSTMRIWASGPLTLKVDLDGLVGAPAGGPQTLNLESGTRELRIGKPPQRGADFDLSGGHFFTQTNGRKDSPAGFSVTDEDGIPFWTAFKSLGGVDALGYPVSRRFDLDGFVVQAFQKSVLQWHPDRREFWYLNTFDVLHDRGRDDWLDVYRQTPRPLDTAPDKGLTWDRVVERHLGLLDKAPAALKERFLAEPNWVDHFGLPVAVQDFSNSVVVRCQRATLQYWKEAVPWATKGSVSVANGGDLAKEAGLFPWLAVTPENAPR